MLNLTVVILAVGESRRFKKEGYDTPKQFLTIEHQGVKASMLEHVNRTLPPFVSRLFVLPNYTRPPADLQIDTNDWITIMQTGGQAESAINAMKYVHEGHSVMFLDCDMLLARSDLDFMLRSLFIYDGVVAVTKTFDPNASRVNAVPHPTFFAEKEAISEWGIVSARGFKDYFKLVTALHAGILSDRFNQRHPYLTGTLMNYPGKIYAHVLQKPIVDWGTPERVRASGAVIWK